MQRQCTEDNRSFACWRQLQYLKKVRKVDLMEKKACEDAVKLLKDILEIPSVNGKDDEGAVAEYLDQYFKEHGIESRVDRIDETHANVIAVISGEGEETEIWNGHLDTVPYGDLDKWETEPWRVTEHDGKLFARGASDMKSGLAAMAFTLTHLPGRPKRTIQFIGTCDEEKGGLGARRVAEMHQMEDSRFMLIGEPTDLRPGAAQKGCLWLRLSVKGKTCHGAYPERGANAIHGLFQAAGEIKDYVEQFSHPFLGQSTAQINWIGGGGAFNMTADSCEAVMDIRMVPGLDTDMVLKRAEEAADRLKKENRMFDCVFKAENNRRAIEIEEDHEKVCQLKEILGRKELNEESIGINFFTDASILAEHDLEQKVLLFGPGKPNLAHQPNEYVEIEAYLTAVEVLTEMADCR